MFSGKKNPDWLDWLKGESPLLPASEIEFIAEVRSRIIQEAKSSEERVHVQAHRCYHDDNRSEIKLSILKDNFKQVVDYLRKSPKSFENFLELYPEWCTARESSIRQLKLIANTIETDRKSYYVSFIVYTVVSLFGGVVCLATGGWFIHLGSGLIALGTLADAALCEAEFLSLRREIEKAKKVIKEDQEYSQKVWNWFNDGSDVQEAVDIINSIDVDHELKKVTRKLLNLDLTQLGKSLKNIMVEFPPQLDEADADIVGILIATTKLALKYHSVFEIIMQAKEVAQNWASGISGMDQFVSPLTLWDKMSILLDMAANVISLFSENSDSKEALFIKEAVNKLQQEKNIYDDLYRKIRVWHSSRFAFLLIQNENI